MSDTREAYSSDHSSPLWDTEPILTFELLRDHAVYGLSVAIKMLELAQRAAPDVLLSQLPLDKYHQFPRAVEEGQSIWYDSLVRRFLVRPLGPVYLDTLPDPLAGRVSGSCYHELALAIAYTLTLSISQGVRARTWANKMWSSTAAGSATTERWLAIVPEVECESLAAIEKWKRDGAAADRQRPSAPAGTNQTADREARERTALAELLLIGPNAKRIAESIGVPRGTLLGWPKFRRYYDAARRDAAVRKSSLRGRRAGEGDFQSDDDE